MRFFILILIFINIGVWTYLNQDYFFQVESVIDNEEINADQLTLLNEHQLEALRKSQTQAEADKQETSLEKTVEEIAKPEPKEADIKKPTEKKVALSCYRWGEFGESALANAQAVTKTLGIKTIVIKTQQATAKRYWVYMPPAASAEEAKKTAEALKAQGVADLYIMNSPEWKNAISFGVFSDRQYADNMLKSLNAKGITNVVSAPRGQTQEARYRLRLNDVSAAAYEKLKAKQNSFPKAKLELKKCQ